ncbi:hypothetical protein FQA45_09600 [Glutamicibacter halophytocola]|uniref:5,10-methylene-tetrahydrofolate dehydrogenase n=1 Tax=Glutamicibacter halophytocola TaxID=1933880 RepID=A0ABX5YA73_9MICC|nr:hypothetical protein [Glutamicibacter halophytocola]QDY66561.1 hypothetical protein FQA45_09600 [Glutamicibacter halophytocola]
MNVPESSACVVGLIADPGTADAMANRVARRLEGVLAKLEEHEVHWEVQVAPFSLPLGDSGRVALEDKVPKLREKHGWDYIIYLTDAPHYVQQRPVRSVVASESCSAVLSMPSLGLARPRNVASALAELVKELSTGQPPGSAPTPLGRAISVHASWQDAENEQNRISSIEGLRGRLLLIAGMVRSNRPWKLVPRLSSALAGAVATGAFGVFYTSIWSMADYLSTQRLWLITLSSIAILTLWLLLHNRLWESPKGSRRRERLVVYNAATVLTVGFAAAAMYLLMFLALLAGALIVIDQEYLAYQLRHGVTLADYVNLAWLASSLGTMGGAIGSSFENVEEVQRATFSQREYERRNMEFSISAPGDEPS